MSRAKERPASKARSCCGSRKGAAPVQRLLVHENGSVEIAMRGRGDYTVVDEVDAEWVAQRSWFGECNDGTGYVRCDRPCGKPGEYLHRLILLQLGDPPHPDMTVDHIDTDGFNNRRDNLRWAWPKEQTGNRGRGGTPRCR